MKVTLFGATGKTGPYLIEEGLKRQMDITVFARTGSEFDDPRVKVVRGSLTDNKALRAAICGADAVVSALGPTRFPHPQGMPITTATKAIIAAMKDEGVSRFVATSTGTAPDVGDTYDWKIRLPALLIRFAMATTYRDIIGLAEAIRNSGLDWTMVRLAVLNHSAPAQKLNVGLYGKTRHSWTVSRADAAAFMLNQLGESNFSKAAPGISAVTK
ncbi:NmrA family transcriptional regulator [Comamonas thiooxydans]|uniref:NAD(P)-dependent oxidoreductase n=1 Tax=Comamonas thiooxydans TaxID=363952 RepID=UPI001E474A6E|nr:NAD(P)H-binding protein [Comamonas thiooxydans]BDB72280.1 NmrA family transcriptional regulator [Comamonas thiooxydans]